VEPDAANKCKDGQRKDYWRAFGTLKLHAD
jgi:hypothetical protein